MQKLGLCEPTCEHSVSQTQCNTFSIHVFSSNTACMRVLKKNEGNREQGIQSLNKACTSVNEMCSRLKGNANTLCDGSAPATHFNTLAHRGLQIAHVCSAVSLYHFGT